jgi:hypothetical protein
MYEVMTSSKIKTCLKFANLVNRKKWIPITLVKKATQINSRKQGVPVNYQNLWLCLHQQIVRKMTSKGYKLIKVLFSPIRVERNKRILRLIEKVIEVVGLEQFAYLCTRSKWTVYKWLSKEFVPLTAVMKACQLLGKDLWKTLDGCKLAGTHHFITFKSELTPYQKQNLRDIIDWINTEGSIPINGWSVTIAQHIENKHELEELKRKFMMVFDLPENMVSIYDYKNTSILRISSSVIRQLLVLRYKLPLGEKSEVVEISKINWRTVANFIITEGCFYLNGRGTGLAAGIVSKSDKVRSEIKAFLKKNGFHPSESRREGGKQVYIQRKKEGLRFLYKVWPYLNYSKKLQACKVLENPKVFLSLRVDVKKVRILIKEFVNLYGMGKFLEIVNQECERYKIKKYSPRSIEHWVYPEQTRRTIPLFVVQKMCAILEEDISNFVDPVILEVFKLAGDFLKKMPTSSKH